MVKVTPKLESPKNTEEAPKRGSLWVDVTRSERPIWMVVGHDGVGYLLIRLDTGELFSRHMVTNIKDVFSDFSEDFAEIKDAEIVVSGHCNDDRP